MRRPTAQGANGTRGWKRAAVSGVLALGVALAPRMASAQGIFGGSGPSGPSRGIPDVEDSPESGFNPKQGKNSVKLFDQRRSIISYQLDIGPIWHRKVQDESPEEARRGWERGAPLASEIGMGTVFTTPKGPFFIVGHTKMILRIIDDKSFSWSLLHQDLGGGLMIGPFEPEVRFRLSVFSADIFHAEPSLQLLSPGVSIGAAIHIGKIRLDIKAHSEYLWRWFGPDYLVRGVTIGLRFDRTRPKTPYPGAPEVQ